MTNTSPTDINCTVKFGRVVVGDSLLQNLPGDAEVNVIVFKIPYMLLLIVLQGLLTKIILKEDPLVYIRDLE